MKVAVVLGAAVRPDGTPSPTLKLRTDHAISLFHAGQVTCLCLTGGQGRYGRPEAVVAADLARAAHVPESALLIERTSKTTIENIENAQQLLPPGAHVILVSNRWHLPRAALIARLLGLRVGVSGPTGRLSTPQLARAVAREVFATPRSAYRAVRSARRTGR